MEYNSNNVPNIPDKWKEWVLTERIGEGSFGTVYSACHMTDNEECAFKFIPVHLPDRQKIDALPEEVVEEIYQESVQNCLDNIKKIQGLSSCSNILKIMDYDVQPLEDRTGWMIYQQMELLIPFEEYIINHKMEYADVLKLGIDISRALEVCHNNHILHCDIKPSNILVTEEGDYKLGDFGIMKDMEFSALSVTMRGTFSYMPPEIMNHTNAGYDSDLYSLGIILYKLMNKNRLPFEDTRKRFVTHKAASDASLKRLKGEPLPYPEDAPDEFSKVILKACEYKRNERYETAIAFRKAMENCIGINDKTIRRKKRKKSRMIWMLAASNLLLLAFVAVLLYPTISAKIDAYRNRDIYADVYFNDLHVVDYEWPEELPPCPDDGNTKYLLVKDKSNEYCLYTFRILLTNYSLFADHSGDENCSTVIQCYTTIRGLEYVIENNEWIINSESSDEIISKINDLSSNDIIALNFFLLNENRILLNPGFDNTTKMIIESRIKDLSRVDNYNDESLNQEFSQRILPYFDTVNQDFLNILNDKQLLVSEAEILISLGFVLKDEALRNHFRIIGKYNDDEHDILTSEEVLCCLDSYSAKDLKMIQAEEKVRGIEPVLDLTEWGSTLDYIISCDNEYTLSLSNIMLYSESALEFRLGSPDNPDSYFFYNAAKCEILARYGYMFDDYYYNNVIKNWLGFETWADYFWDNEWYNPNPYITPDDIELSQIEEYNYSLLEEVYYQYDDDFWQWYSDYDALLRFYRQYKTEINAFYEAENQLVEEN